MTQDIVQKIKLQPEGGAQTSAALQKVRADLNNVSSEASRATATAKQLASALSSSGGGGFNLNSARGIAGQAGGLLALTGNSQISSAASSILGLTATLGPVGIAAGVVGIAFSRLQAELEASKKAADDYANRLKSTADLVAGGMTSDDARRQIENAKAADEVVTNQLKRITDLRDYLRTIIPDATSEEAARVRDSLSRASGGKGDSAFQTMAAVFKEVSAITGVSVNDFTQLGQAIDSVTLKSTEYNTKIYDLNTQIRDGIFAHNDAAVAAKLDADAAEKAADAEKKLAEQRSATATKITSTLLDALANEVATREKITAAETEMSDIRSEAAAKVTEIQADGRDRQIEIATETADAIAKILRDAGREQSTAIASRDALALHLSKVAAQDQLDDQRKASEKQAAQLEKQLTKQVSATVTAMEKELAAKQRAYSQLQVDLQNYLAAERALTYNHSIGVLTQTDYMWQAIEAGAAATARNVAAIWNNLWAFSGGGTPGSGSPLPPVTGTAALNRVIDSRIAATIRIP